MNIETEMCTKKKTKEKNENFIKMYPFNNGNVRQFVE